MLSTVVSIGCDSILIELEDRYTRQAKVRSPQAAKDQEYIPGKQHAVRRVTTLKQKKLMEFGRMKKCDPETPQSLPD